MSKKEWLATVLIVGLILVAFAGLNLTILYIKAKVVGLALE